MNWFDKFTAGDVVFILVVAVGTLLLVYLANRGRNRDKEGG